LEASIAPETAAVMIEPVQGEGGVRAVPDQCLRGIRELCDRHGLLLILDEVQSGVGRTGRFLAHEWAGITPDIVAVAKGIGGGFPLGAVLATEEAAKGMTAGTHGSTFGGNPLATAVGNAVLDVVLEPGFLDGVAVKALQLKQGLEGLKDQHPGVVDAVRGRGLLLGLKLTPDIVAGDVVRAAAARERLLLVGAGDNVVRVLPPLIVDDGEISDALSRLSRVLATAGKSNS
ncbi:MAG: aminotransferase class III-fold pyridoxal phosphate-dependent enzyme, partial [Hyphomicrobium sp.]